MFSGSVRNKTINRAWNNITHIEFERNKLLVSMEKSRVF